MDLIHDAGDGFGRIVPRRPVELVRAPVATPFLARRNGQDKQAAYETLYFVLMQFTKLVAPFIPFTAEAIYQNLAFGDGHADDLTAAMLPKSVHHTLYPKYSAETLDQALLDKMALAITAASLGRAARGSADIKLRQPLAKVRINVGSEQQRADLMELTDVLQEEINVKAIEVVSEVGELVDYKILPNNRELGPKFGKQFPAVRKALTALDAADVARSVAGRWRGYRCRSAAKRLC